MNALVTQSVPQVTFLLPVYIVYAQSKSQYDSTYAFELRALRDMAEVEELDPHFSPTNKKILGCIEEGLRFGSSIEEIFRAIHSCEISFFPIFWFAGEGSNPFARALLKHVYLQRKCLEIVDYSPTGSILSKQIEWFRGHNQVQEYLKRKAECA